jgi:hypothetical protein
MFHRAATKTRPPTVSRTRLDLNPLEDRTVLSTTITIEAVSANAIEGGASGIVRVTRTGDTSGYLEGTFSVSGTATMGNDYPEPEFLTFAFEPTATTWEWGILATDDGIVEPTDETVVVTLNSGPGYTVGSPSSATVTLINTDTIPVAFDGWVVTSVNTPAVVEVLDLSTDLDEDTLTVTGVTQGEDGSVIINMDGTVTYTPDTEFVGDDEFTYTVEDPYGNEATGTISVTVTTVLAPPTSVWTAENTAVTIDVLELAFDPDGDELTTTGVTQGDDGAVVINPDGSVTYTPDTGFTGIDSFTYTVEDPDGNEATHTITVTVGGTDPITPDDIVATPVNTAVNVEVLDLAFDPAGDTLEVVSVTQGANGTVVINPDGTVTYTPNTGFEGTDSFTYTVEDDDENTSTGTVEVTVGEPEETEVDEILEDLEAIEEEIENYDYDEETPQTIQGMIPGLVTAITDYLDNFTTLISTSSVSTIGVNKPIDDYVEAVWRAFKTKLYPAYMKLLEMENALWNRLVEIKNLIESIKAQLVVEMSLPTPNAATIGLLSLQLKTLIDAQKPLVGVWFMARMKAGEAYTEALQAWRVLAKDMPPSIIPLYAPPAPPVRDPGDIIPR